MPIFGMSRDHNRKRLKLGLSGGYNYNFRNIVHFLKCMLQVADNAVFSQNVLLYNFRK